MFEIEYSGEGHRLYGKQKRLSGRAVSFQEDSSAAEQYILPEAGGSQWRHLTAYIGDSTPGRRTPLYFQKKDDAADAGNSHAAICHHHNGQLIRYQRNQSSQNSPDGKLTVADNEICWSQFQGQYGLIHLSAVRSYLYKEH